MRLQSWLFCLFTATQIWAEAPFWTSQPPAGYDNDFFVGRAQHSEQIIAQILAKNDALFGIARTQSGALSAKLESKSLVQEKQGSKNSYSRNDSLKSTLKLEIPSVSISNIREVESYCEPSFDSWSCWSLLARPKAHPKSKPWLQSGSWRSIFVPGWGQIYNGKSKGYLFMLSSLALVGGTAYAHVGVVNSHDEAWAATSQARRDFYNRRTREMVNLRNLCGITAIAIYAWNLGDALFAPNNDKYVVDYNRATFWAVAF